MIIKISTVNLNMVQVFYSQIGLGVAEKYIP